MAFSTNVTPEAKKVLDDALAHLHQSDDPTEFHLPEEVIKLEKPELLALLYRVLAKAVQ